MNSGMVSAMTAKRIKMTKVSITLLNAKRHEIFGISFSPTENPSAECCCRLNPVSRPKAVSVI